MSTARKRLLKLVAEARLLVLPAGKRLLKRPAEKRAESGLAMLWTFDDLEPMQYDSLAFMIQDNVSGAAHAKKHITEQTGGDRT